MKKFSMGYSRAVTDCFFAHTLGVCDTANFGIDPIPSKYKASIADTDPDPDTCHLKIHTFK